MRISLLPALAVLALVGVVALGLVAIEASSDSGASAAQPAGLAGPVAWGNLDCSPDGVTTRDNQALLRFVLDQSPLSQTPPCPAINTQVFILGFGNILWGNLDCSPDGVTTRDNQALLRFVLDQSPLSQTPPCPAINTIVMSGTPTPSPTPDPANSIDLTAIDADISGNTPTSIGSIEDCVSVGTGEQVQVDVVVDSVPNPDGTAGFQFNLVYDTSELMIPAPLTAGAPDVNQMLGNTAIDFTLGDPDGDGVYTVAAADIVGSAESGAGVLARITVEGLTAGVHDLALDFAPPDNSINHGSGIGTYNILEAQSAQIAVGTACS